MMPGWRFMVSTFLLFSFCLYTLLEYSPRVVKQPLNDEILIQVGLRADENGIIKQFSIECEADGKPTPKYRWMKNGKELLRYNSRIRQQSGSGTLVISNPRDDDIGQYQCFAYNKWGVVTFNSVVVRQKSYLNSFKDESEKTVSALEGSPFNLRCQPPDGWPKPLVFWMMQYKTGFLRSILSPRMTVDPEGTLWLSNVTRQDASDDFVYVCVATTPSRNEFKLGNKVYLDVIATKCAEGKCRHKPVRQYVSNNTSIAYRGKSIELWCVFGGTPLPRMSWTKKDAILPSRRTIFSSWVKTLKIKNVNRDDAGNYECEAFNGVGPVKSHSFSLKVLDSPYLTVESKVNGVENLTAEFSNQQQPARWTAMVISFLLKIGFSYLDWLTQPWFYAYIVFCFGENNHFKRRILAAIIIKFLWKLNMDSVKGYLNSESSSFAIPLFGLCYLLVHVFVLRLQRKISVVGLEGVFKYLILNVTKKWKNKLASLEVRAAREPDC